jgi:hypothetical protein
MDNPDLAGRKAFIKVYEDALVKALVNVFDSASVSEAAAQAFKKAYTAAGGKNPAVPIPGSATRLKGEVLEAFREQAGRELGAAGGQPGRL